MTRPAAILVAGAGPAGLALALQAHDHGGEVRVIERRPEPFRPSRALILHARTLEVLRPLGVTEALLARADTAPEVSLRLGRRTARVRLGDLELPDTAFPHPSLVRQADVEEVLAQALAGRGVTVERGVELAGIRDDGAGVQAAWRSGAAAGAGRFDFVAGCDGPASTVRAQAGIGWPGRPYPVEVVLADAELDLSGDLAGDLSGGAAQVAAGRRGLCFAFPLGEQASWRLLATRPAGPPELPFGQPGPPVPAAELQQLMDQAGLPARLTRLAWSARVQIQHRVAERFRSGRLFLVGDAAHAYSPATGQGMNAAIQDAANLGWKLALGPAGAASEALLDSYERERRPVARQVLALTHLAFWGEAATGRLPSLLRGLAPLAAPAVPALTSRRRLIAAGYRRLALLDVSYRGSPLSVDPAAPRGGRPRAGDWPRAGDRLPDMTVTCGGRRIRLHELLARPGVHVLLERDADPPPGTPPGPLVAVHRLTSVPGRGLLAVRPDGYIGLRCPDSAAGPLLAWLALAGAS